MGNRTGKYGSKRFTGRVEFGTNARPCQPNGHLLNGQGELVELVARAISHWGLYGLLVGSDEGIFSGLTIYYTVV